MAGRQFVRVKADPTSDNSDTYPIYLDLVIHSGGDVAGSEPIFGYQGELGSRKGHSWPFVLYYDGTLDYGDQYEEGDRLFRLNIREAGVRLGELLTLSSSEGDEFFRIAKVTQF